MKRFIIFLIIIWIVLFLLQPGYTSGLLVPILLYLTWGGTDEPSFKPLHSKHADINRVMKKDWFRELILRKKFKPKSFRIIWLFVFLFLSATPGIFISIYLTPSVIHPFYFAAKVLWWTIFTPILMISTGYFFHENLFGQILAMPFIFGIPALGGIAGLIYLAYIRLGIIGIILVVLVIVLPIYILDLSRFLRQHYFPKSYNKY